MGKMIAATALAIGLTFTGSGAGIAYEGAKAALNTEPPNYGFAEVNTQPEQTQVIYIEAIVGALAITAGSIAIAESVLELTSSDDNHHQQV